MKSERYAATVGAQTYVVMNLVNGKLYIGVTSRKVLKRRMCEHFSAARRRVGNGILHKAIRRYGEENFAIVPLQSFSSYEHALREEIRLISELRPDYNTTLGGTGFLGRAVPQSQRDFLRELHRGNKYRLGKCHSEPTKRRLSEIGLTQKETWAKYAHLGPKASRRRVIRIDDGKVFESATDAARECGVARSALIELCLGKRYRKTVGGMRFRYEDAA